jgi:hypothetical protein
MWFSCVSSINEFRFSFPIAKIFAQIAGRTTRISFPFKVASAVTASWMRVANCSQLRLLVARQPDYAQLPIQFHQDSSLYKPKHWLNLW